MIKTRITAAGTRLDIVDTGKFLVETYLSGASPEVLHSALPDEGTSLRQIGGGVLASHQAKAAGGSLAEQDKFAGHDVIFGFRNAESVETVAAWIGYHGTLGATAALIFDRSSPDEAHVFAGALNTRLRRAGSHIPVCIVAADAPLGTPEGVDLRDPRSAPAWQELHLDALSSDWHSRLAEPILLEAIRHRWLNAARTVTFLDVCDLLLPPKGSPNWFDRVAQSTDRPIPLEGREHYAWRLRSGRACLSDHVFMRFGEKRWLVRWAVAPDKLPSAATWLPIRVEGTRASGEKGHFVRAMNAAFGDAGTSEIVKKSDLVEDAAVSAAFNRTFNRKPLRPRLPELSVGRDRTLVITAMKNEGPFILDWIAHHRAVGVDHFLVYTNDCEDGTDRLLDALSASGIVTRRDNPYRATQLVPQHAAFRAAESEVVVHEAGWLMTLDVDEYVNIHVGAGRLDDLRAHVSDATVISMPWRLFGNADIETFENRPVTEQFTRCARLYTPKPHQAWGFKTLYRNAGLFRRLGVHRPRGMVTKMRGHVRWVGGDGRPLPPEMWRNAWRMTDKTWGYDLVTLNHYSLRSAESYLVKRERGRVNHTDRGQGTAYWFRMNHNADEDKSIARYAPETAVEKRRLLALPGVSRAHEDAILWHQNRIVSLKSDPELASLFEQITGPRLRQLSRMLDHFGSNVFHAGPDVIPEDVATRDPDADWTFSVPAAPRAD